MPISGLIFKKFHDVSLGTIIQARMTSLSNLNFDDFLNSVVQDQYGMDFSQYIPADAGKTSLTHSQPHRDNTMQNVIGHIYG